MIPERPLLRPGTHVYPFRDALMVRRRQSAWKVERPATAVLATMLDIVDGRPATALVKGVGLEHTQTAIALLEKLADAGLLIDVDDAAPNGQSPAIGLDGPTLSEFSVAVHGSPIGSRDLAFHLRRRGADVSCTIGFEYPARLPPVDLLVTFLASPQIHLLRELNSQVRRAWQSWLVAFPLCGEFYVSPVFMPSVPLCWRCLELRWLGIAPSIASERALFAHLAAGAWRRESMGQHLEQTFAEQVGNIASEVLLGIRPHGVVTAWSSDVEEARHHRLVAHPLCEDCAAPPALAAATWNSNPEQPLVSTGTDRLLDVFAPLHDDRFGVVAAVQSEQGAPSSTWLTATARFSIPRPADVDGDNDNIAGGVGIGARCAMGIAGIEAIERYCALSGGEPTITASYNAVAADALRPTDIPLYAPEQYRTPGFPFRQFHPDVDLSWVAGFDLVDRRTRLVPHDIVFCAPTIDELTGITTSGVAAHTSRWLALLTAIFELVERDAFMIHWLHRISPPRVRHETIREPRSVDALAELHRGSYTTAILDITTDLGIPAILAIAFRHYRPALLVGARAACCADDAIAGALKELIVAHRAWLIDGSPAEEPMEQSRVRTILDHERAYAHPDWLQNASFLWSSNEERSIAEIRPLAGDVCRDPLTLAKLLRKKGFSTVAVDMTTPDVASCGISVVRAVVPGLVAIGFGPYGLRLGGSRLYTAPAAMGIDAARSFDELNTVPHCFP